MLTSSRLGTEVPSGADTELEVDSLPGMRCGHVAPSPLRGSTVTGRLPCECWWGCATKGTCCPVDLGVGGSSKHEAWNCLLTQRLHFLEGVQRTGNHCGRFARVRPQRQPKCPRCTSGQRKWHRNTVDYYSAFKRGKILPLVTTWINPE